jgi:hypothetical protein
MGSNHRKRELVAQIFLGYQGIHVIVSSILVTWPRFLQARKQVRGGSSHLRASTAVSNFAGQPRDLSCFRSVTV